MEAYFTILILVALVISLILITKTQITNRKCFIKSMKNLEKYGLYDKDNREINISRLLDNISSHGSEKKIGEIVKNYTYTKGNFDRSILDEAKNLINTILNNINETYELFMKLYDVERIEEIVDNKNNKQYIVVFSAHRVNRHASSQLVLSYFKSNNNDIEINYIKTESSSLVGKNTKDNLVSYRNMKSDEVFHKTIQKDISNNEQVDFAKYKPIMKNFNAHLEENKKLVKLHEPCKYNLHEWDLHGVSKQMRLNKRCSVGNNSTVLPPSDPYYNPTMHSASISLDIEPKYY